MITLHIGSRILQQQACPSAKTIATRTAGVRRCFQSTKPSASQSSSIFNAANDYFSSLRWKAADTLTSSLAEEERNQLMQKLEPKFEDKHSEKDNHVPERSIDEAVAAARAQEVERHQQKWEDQKEKLLQEAEEAARARIESDLLIQKRQLAFEAWKRDLEKEKEMNQSTTTSINTTAATQENVGDHPILGPILYDLGHKRIHVASAKALASIPVWKKQRIYRHGRAKSMASDKMKTLHLGLPGIIGIYESKDGSLSILDGQHRLGMLKVLQEKADPSDFDFDHIMVEVYPQREDLEEVAHAQEIFLEVNKAEPVKLVDLPGVATAAHRNVINEGASKLLERYPEMFKASQRCRAPHLNIDNLRDALFASKVIDRHSLKTPKALEQWIIGQNESLATKYQSEEPTEFVSESALKKAIKHDFYLGLESSWLYN